MAGTLFDTLAARCVSRGKPVESRKIGHNTFAERRADGAVAVRYHATDVVTAYPDGRVVVNTDGWWTPTTKLRLNSYVPGIGFYSDKGARFMVQDGRGWEHAEHHAYRDGLTFTPDDDGKLRPVVGTFPSMSQDEAERRAVAKLRRAAKRYADGLAPTLATWSDMIRNGEAPNGGGDCFLCLAGAPGPDHFWTHLEEGYLPVRMLANTPVRGGYSALGELRYRPEAVALALRKHVVSMLRDDAVAHYGATA